MFSKGNTNRPRQAGLHQFGLMDVPDISGMEDNIYGKDDDDGDFEAELAALTAGHEYVRPKRKAPKQDLFVDLSDLDKIGEDIPDDELSEGDDDPDLLAELASLEAEAMPAPIAPPIQPRLTQQHAAGARPAPPIPTAGSRPAPPIPTAGLRPAPSIPTAGSLVAPPAPAPPQRTAAGRNSPDAEDAASGATDIMTLLTQRLHMYTEAAGHAKALGESSKARRFQRGIQTLENQVKSARAGKLVSVDDIPPPVAIPHEEEPQPPASDEAVSAPRLPTPPLPAPAVAQPEDVPAAVQPAADPTIVVLRTRRDQYKVAALQAKKGGDRVTAVRHVKVIKQFDQVIAALESGQPVDLAGMPPPPPGFPTEGKVIEPPPAQQRVTEARQGLANTEAVEEEEIEGNPEEEKTLFQAPEAPSTVAEALQQRLAKYRECEKQAKSEGVGDRKARRMGRIVKQYETAIRNHKAGKPVTYDELPTPPGFAPIPSESTPKKPGARTPAASPAQSDSSQSGSSGVTPVRSSQASPGSAGKSSTTPPDKAKRLSKQRSATMSRQEQQMAFLVERHNLFREAALDAKRRGELTQAKEHLRKMKGFEPMMDACRNGLPVDMSKVPVPPQLKVSPSSDMPTQSVAGSGESDREKLYNKLEEQLIQQTKVCSKNSQHYMQLGDVGSASKYDKMAEGCKKDLDALRHAFKHGDPVPKFHYDNRTMSVVQSCLDLGDNDMELIIVRGINYSSSTAPKDLDTYIRWEFPYPSDTPPQGKISTVKDTNNPEYNAKVKLQINRKSRSFLRLVKRHYIKLEVFAKGGFLRGDTSLGSVKVPLQPLETHCIVHQSYDMMDGRKAVGGRVEVKLRIRDPFVSKQVEETKEKWLIIDQWLRSSPSKGPLQTPM